MELVFVIVIVILVGVFKQAANQEEQRKAYQARKEQNPWTQTMQQMPKQTVRTTPAREQVQQQNAQWQQAARENIEKAKQRATQKMHEFEKDVISELHRNGTPENKSAMQQVYEGRMEARNTTILERAMANADEDKVDVTLHTMEAEHNHSERVAPAQHHHPEDVIPENMLGTVEDLMVKGYDGNLCFERDFVGEAMDMISRFTVPSDVPDYSKNDVA